MAEGGQAVFPVVSDTGMLIGIVTRRDLASVMISDPMLQQTLMVEDLQLVDHTQATETDTLQKVLNNLDAEDVDGMVVVSRFDRFRVIGVVSHNDVVEAYQREISAAR